MTHQADDIHTIKLLVVDDELAILSSYKRFFHNKPIDLFVASSVDESITLLESQTIDVLLTDLKMPVKSGFDLLQSSERFNPDIIKLVISGYSNKDDLLLLLNNYKIDYFFEKPADYKAIEYQIKYFYQRQQAENLALKSNLKKLRVLSQFLEITPDTLISNRRALERFYSHQIEIYIRYNVPFSVLLCSIHQNIFDKNDDCLKNDIQIIKNRLRNIDLLGQINSKLLMIICPHTDAKGIAFVEYDLINKLSSECQDARTIKFAGLEILSSDFTFEDIIEDLNNKIENDSDKNYDSIML